MITFLLHTLTITAFIVVSIAAGWAFLYGMTASINYFGFPIVMGCSILLLSAMIAVATS